MKKKKEQTEINPDVIYDQHTKRDDGRCLGCHFSNLNTGLYEYLKERDFLDQLCDEDVEDVPGQEEDSGEF